MKPNPQSHESSFFAVDCNILGFYPLSTLNQVFLASMEPIGR